MKSSICKVACAIITLATPLAQAAPVTLWDNGGPATETQGGSQMSSFFQAANFTTGFATNLSSTTFWSLEGGSAYAGSISYSIFGSTDGSPNESAVFASGNVAAPSRTTIGSTSLGGLALGIFRYDFDLAVTNLAAGTYWLALHNGALDTGADDVEFYWAWSDANATNGGALDDQERSLCPSELTWGTNQAEHAFLIAGERFIGEQPISEPGTLLLATLAAGLGWTSSRRRTTVQQSFKQLQRQ